MKHCWLGSSSGLLRALVYAAWIAALGCKGARSPNSSNAAPPLPDRTPDGTYSPYYQTGEMSDPRYLHQLIRLKTGQILATGGSDERGFSSLDTAEIFDEVAVRKGETRPPSLTGVWIDTDFEGNPITMEFRRFWHTMTALPDNRVAMIGGTSNWLKARPYEKVEIFDPETRKFETLKDAKMVVPRVRHTATTLLDGTVLIAGGQRHDLFTDLQQATVSGPGQTGTVTFQTQTDIFPTTDRVEVFSFRDLKFTELTMADSTRPSRLTSSRGRCAHATVTISGFDNRLGTGDDLTLLVGGFQTPTSGQLVQDNLLPRRAASAIGLKTLEIYDPTARIFLQIGTVLMGEVRVNDPNAINLGTFNERTPDNVPGLGNVVFICGGDDNVQCWTSAIIDEVMAATFTGLGPAQGLVLSRVDLTTKDDPIARVQGGEYGTNQQQFETPVPPGRQTSNAVALPRNIESRPGQLTVGTWIFFGAGAHTWCAPPPCTPCSWYGGTIGAGAIFDPMYRLLLPGQFALTPKPNARDLKDSRDILHNPTGVVGAWLAVDGKLPSIDRVGYGDTDVGVWPLSEAIRVYGGNIALPGEDGILNTSDDRVLLTGGGQDVLNFGGEVSEPAAEIFLVPPSP